MTERDVSGENSSTQNAGRYFVFFSTIASILKYFVFLTGAIVVVILAGHYAIGLAGDLKQLVSPGTISGVDPRAKAPAYDNAPYKHKMWAETIQCQSNTARFRPYYLWKLSPFVGEYVNIDKEGNRLTIKSPKQGAVKVFCFGGSTMWGCGAPDDKTIPSILQSMLGDGYDVYNFGESGYVTTQELNYLLERLSLGDIPDIVIFYDGVNDGYAGTYSPAQPREPQNIGLSFKPKSLYMELLDRSNYRVLSNFLGVHGMGSSSSWDEKIKPFIESNAKKTLDVYDGFIKQVKALAVAYDFKVYFFWQPNLFSLTKKNLSDYEKNRIDIDSKTFIASQKAIYDEAALRLPNRESENIIFLGNIFDDLESSVYIDWCHIGPDANAIVAARIFGVVSDK